LYGRYELFLGTKEIQQAVAYHLFHQFFSLSEAEGGFEALDSKNLGPEASSQVPKCPLENRKCHLCHKKK